MPLQRQTIPINFTQGPDTKGDPLQVRGKLITLENATFQTPGRLTKRNGHSALSQAVSNYQSNLSFSVIPNAVASGNTLAAFFSETVLMDGFNLFSYAPATATWVWKGNAALCKETSQPITGVSTVANSFDSIVVGSYEYVAYQDSISGLKASVVDLVTRNVVWSGAVPIGGIQPRWCTVAGHVYLLSKTGSSVLRYTEFTPTPSAGTTLISDLKVHGSSPAFYPVYDAANLPNGALVIAYDSTANGITALKATASLASVTTFQLNAESAANSISVFGDPSGQTWIAWGNSSQAKYLVLNAAFNATALAPTVLASVTNNAHVTGVYDPITTQAFVFFDTLNTASNLANYPDASTSYATGTLVGSVTTGLFIGSASIAAKAFLVAFGSSNVPHVGLVHDSALQGTYFIAAMYNTPLSTIAATIVGKALYGLGTGTRGVGGVNFVPNAPAGVSQSGTAFRFAVGFTVTSTTQGVSILAFDFSAKPLPNLTLGANLLVGGAQLLMYDGQQVVEHGFHNNPEGVTVTMVGSGGSLSAGTYGWQAVYAWTDAQGQVHRSGPSVVVSKTAVLNDSATVVIPTLRLTNKLSVVIELYRTQVNGALYTLVTTVANSTTTNSVTITDGASDASILSNTQLYTTGSVVANTVAPPVAAMCTYKNRAILVAADSPTTWWYSQQTLPGSPVTFALAFTQNIAAEGGSLTNVLQLDSSLVLFKASSIYYVQGDGPASTGVNNDFTAGQQIAADCGCTQPPSVVLMPQGVMFQGAKGFYLLGRNLVVEYVGADMEAFNSQACTSATLIRNTTQVRFAMSGGVQLVFDYYARQWSVFTGIAAVSACVDFVTGMYQFLTAIGQVLREVVGSHADAGFLFALKVRTGWMDFAGIGGFQRARRLLITGDSAAPSGWLSGLSPGGILIFTAQTGSNLQVTLGYDFDQDSGQTSIVQMGSPDQWRVDLARQKCEALQIELIESVEAGGNPFSISVLSLECGIKKGTQKLPATRQVG